MNEEEYMTSSEFALFIAALLLIGMLIVVAIGVGLSVVPYVHDVTNCYFYPLSWECREFRGTQGER